MRFLVSWKEGVKREGGVIAALWKSAKRSKKQTVQGTQRVKQHVYREGIDDVSGRDLASALRMEREDSLYKAERGMDWTGASR